MVTLLALCGLLCLFSYIFCHVSTSYCSCSLKPRGANDLRVRDVSSNGTGLQEPQRVFNTAVGLINVGKSMDWIKGKFTGKPHI